MNKRLTYLQKLVESGKADAFAFYALAMEYKNSGQFDDAARTFDELKSAHPAYLPQYLMAGQMHLDHDDPDTARSWLAAGLALAKDTGDGKTASEIEAALALC